MHSEVAAQILTALTPTVAVFLAVLIQRQDVRDLRSEVRAEISGLRTQMQSEMVSLRNQVHADLLMIHERVAKIEVKQGL